jgi:type I restriction enzyme M protein
VTAPALVQKLWNYCNPAAAGRDDGLSYGDSIEVRAARAFSFRLFLTMADEQSRPPFNKPSPIPKGFGCF